MAWYIYLPTPNSQQWPWGSPAISVGARKSWLNWHFVVLWLVDVGQWGKYVYRYHPLSKVANIRYKIPHLAGWPVSHFDQSSWDISLGDNSFIYPGGTSDVLPLYRRIRRKPAVREVSCPDVALRLPAPQTRLLVHFYSHVDIWTFSKSYRVSKQASYKYCWSMN